LTVALATPRADDGQPPDCNPLENDWQRHVRHGASGRAGGGDFTVAGTEIRPLQC
jgi:hypothetical protein